MRNPFKKEDKPEPVKGETYIHQDLVRVRREDPRDRALRDKMIREEEERKRRQDPRDRAWGRRNK